MKDFSKSLALSFLKAAILTILVVGAIASLSSCERVADRNTCYSNKWRAVALKTGRPLTVINEDSLQVCIGDTVTVFLHNGNVGGKSYYYISNTPETAADTLTMEMYLDGKDTIYEPFEAWNVRLERRIAR